MLCLKSYNHRLVRKEFLGTVFNKHIAIDLFISGRRCRNNVPIFSILQSAASLLPWSTAAILLLLGDSQDPGEMKQVNTELSLADSDNTELSLADSDNTEL